MKRDFYPLELRTTEKRKSIIEYLSRSSWKVKVNTLIVIIATIITIAIILSIPTVPGESFYFENNTYYIGIRPEIYSYQTGPISVYKHLLDFKVSFHIYYWIAVVGYIVAGSGVFLKKDEEALRAIKLYHMINGATIVTGSIKIITMFVTQYYWCYESNIILAAFLTAVPFFMIIPIQLLIGMSKQSGYGWINEIEDNAKIKKTGRIIILVAIGIVSILIAISYLRIEIII